MSPADSALKLARDSQWELKFMLMTWKRLQLEDNVLPHSHQEGAPEGVDVGVKNWHQNKSSCDNNNNNNNNNNTEQRMIGLTIVEESWW